jgi:hypothetical protein
LVLLPLGLLDPLDDARADTSYASNDADCEDRENPPRLRPVPVTLPRALRTG